MSLAGLQPIGRRPAGLSGAAQEVGHDGQFTVAVPGQDLVECGVHSGVDQVEPEDRRAAAPVSADDDAAPVGRIAIANDPPAALQPVENARERGRMLPGCAWIALWD